MSGIGRWSLGIGAGLVVVAVVCGVANLLPAAVITGLVGVAALCIAGYDVVYSWLDRAELRRRGARARERDGHHGR
ncbi:hypothetical protein ACWCPQ_14810 [Nocardia sp. NPDC001965]